MAVASGRGDTDFSSPSPDSVSDSPYVFRIYSDWRGQYWWQLLDAAGREVRVSPWSFSALSGAWRDVLAVRNAESALSAAVIDDRRA